MKLGRTLAFLLLPLLGACTNDGTVGRTGHTRVLLTDSPFPYDRIARVDVHIVRVQVAASADTVNPQAWTTLVEPKRTVNLLELQSGQTTLLGETAVNANTVGAVRLVINTSLSSVTDNAGRAVNVHWPVQGEFSIYSYVQGSLASFAEGTPENLVIDFDVGRSFEDVLGDGSLVFIPWIRALDEAGAGAVAGVVRGPDGSPVSTAAVTVLAGDVTKSPDTWWKIATGKTDAQGHYKVSYILQGTYIVRAEPLGVAPPLGCADKTGIVVSNGETANVDISLPSPPGTCARYTSGGGGPDSTGSGGGGSGGGDNTGGPVASVTITVWPPDGIVGDSSGAHANLFNANGSSLYNRAVTWAVADPTIVQITGQYGQSVILRAKAPGTTTLSATSEGVTGTRAVTVK